MALVLEFAKGGSLNEYINSDNESGRFSEKIAVHYFKQILEGLKHMWKNNLTHRDIKPSNLLLDENFVLKISDFGIATNLNKSKDNKDF
jgi:serine/threonine-protein kinase HSL1 (negative regulator of Swe1 kinase)